MPAPTNDEFFALFPEFSDETKFSAATITAWLNVSQRFVNETRWGDSWSFGVCLFAAHELSIARQAYLSAAAGGAPGSGVGVVASKSVGPLSKSYDNSLSKYSEAGFWNLTTYGQQFWGLSQMFGIGGSQLGIVPGATEIDLLYTPPSIVNNGML